MVSLSACLDFTMRSTHKQKQLLCIPSVSSITVPPAQWAHHLRTIFYWCLWSLFVHTFGETNPQPSRTGKREAKGLSAGLEQQHHVHTKHTQPKAWHQFENNEQFFCYQSQDTANSKFSHRAEQMKLFDHILRTRPHAHSLHTLPLAFITNRSELGLKGNSLSRLSYQIRVRS